MCQYSGAFGRKDHNANPQNDIDAAAKGRIPIGKPCAVGKQLIVEAMQDDNYANSFGHETQ